MCQGRTGKLRGTLSCRLEFDWLELLEIRERKHIIEWRNSGQFFRQSWQLFHIQIYMARWWSCSLQQEPHQFGYCSITLDEKVNPRLSPSKKSYAQENPTDVPLKKNRSRKEIQETSHPILSQWVFSKKRYASWLWTLLWSKEKKRVRSYRFGSLCIVQVQQISQWSHLRILGKCTMQRLPLSAKKTTRMEILMKCHWLWWSRQKSSSIHLLNVCLEWWRSSQGDGLIE